MDQARPAGYVGGDVVEKDSVQHAGLVSNSESAFAGAATNTLERYYPQDIHHADRCRRRRCIRTTYKRGASRHRLTLGPVQPLIESVVEMHNCWTLARTMRG